MARLPREVLWTVVEYLAVGAEPHGAALGDVRACALVCSDWHAAALRQLHRRPVLASRHALLRLVEMLESARAARTRWSGGGGDIDGGDIGGTAGHRRKRPRPTRIAYPGHAVQELNFTLLAGSQSVVTDTLLQRLVELLMWPATGRDRATHSRLRSLRMVDCFLVSGPGLRRIAELAPPLAELECAGPSLECQLAMPALLAAHGARLERVSLSFLHPNPFMADAGAACRRLVEFQIEKPPLRRRGPRGIAHPALSFAPDDGIDDDGVDDDGSDHGGDHGKVSDWIVVGTARLRRLAVRHCAIGDDCIDAMFPHGRIAPLLRDLDLAGCVRISDAAVAAVAHACGALERLVLARCVRITDGSIDVLTAALLAHSLRSLSIAHCTLISLPAVVRLAAMRRLESLDITGIPAVSAKRAAALTGRRGPLAHISVVKA
ncbi:proteasome component M29 [Polyrhizophydium stewartii]|uniref:Proteasome component M29 n=1 Tax=Polyrhizophydium stewartii TaxID=2732419 RepID=A0ABR4N032_9FUNG